MYASVHRCNAKTRGRIHEYSESGTFLRSFADPHLEEPNMLAVQYWPLTLVVMSIVPYDKTNVCKYALNEQTDCV